jgi:hypothetical protein
MHLGDLAVFKREQCVIGIASPCEQTSASSVKPVTRAYFLHELGFERTALFRIDHGFPGLKPNRCHVPQAPFCTLISS